MLFAVSEPSHLDSPSRWDAPESSAFYRMWLGFMAARIGIGVVLSVMLGLLVLLGLTSIGGWELALCGTYVAAAAAVRFFTRPALPGRVFDPQWVSTIGVDLLAFSTLQFQQTAGLNYAPLYALPVLTASVLGSRLLGLGTAAAVTLLLLLDAWLAGLQLSDHAQPLAQAGVTGGGYLLVAMLANELSARLAREELVARRSRLASLVQAHVNQMVIETLADGVLVVGADWRVRAANPAARQLLGWQASEAPSSLALASHPGWLPLVALAQRTFTEQQPQTTELALELAPEERLHLRVRTQLTPPLGPHSDALCLMFLQDLREAEARLRTEKLAAMGRMTAAVAHEIRNPLAAIAQANSLLAEDLSEPGQHHLSALVRKNTQRLSQIVEEILNLARLQQPPADWLELDQSVDSLTREWARQHHTGARVQLLLQAGTAWTAFDGEHLRRILVNLLDNALRYASHRPGAIVVATRIIGQQACLQVWSDGLPLDASVQLHLFEPFFSSESRSSGLGLYICRELCDRHGAAIAYARTPAPDGSGRDGNEFTVTFRTRATIAPDALPFDTIGA
ncbi:MAG TPA: ATP-binding protein [Ramlibacter sp.]|nr:ATP-binding protein [Ramlibacter sp.]